MCSGKLRLFIPPNHQASDTFNSSLIGSVLFESLHQLPEYQPRKLHLNIFTLMFSGRAGLIERPQPEK